jgi:Putative Flp pilus-assembly TadE/G-like
LPAIKGKLSGCSGNARSTQCKSVQIESILTEFYNSAKIGSVYCLLGTGQAKEMNRVSEFSSATGGNVAVITALSAVLLTGVAGLATLFLQSTDSQTTLQASLDAAVLAGTAMKSGTTDKDRIAVAAAIFTANVEAANREGHAQFTVDGAPSFKVKNTEVSGTSFAKVENSLGAALGISSMNVTAKATAEKVESAPLCMLALNGSEPASLEVYGNATLNAINCAVQANSSNKTGMKMYGASKATASEFGVGGDYSGTGWSPPPVNGVEKVKDPFADVPVAVPGSCTSVPKKLSSGKFTLDPGTYCGGLDFGAGAAVFLNPGNYIMKDGQFQVGSGATVTGENVMVALVGANSHLLLMSNSSTKLTSPTEGTYKNIQFMSDRDLSTSKFNQEWTTILAGATLDYDGVMYLPEQQFWTSGTGHDIIIKANSPSLAIVADKVWLQGNVVMQVTQENKRGLEDVANAPGFVYGSRLVD